MSTAPYSPAGGDYTGAAYRRQLMGAASQRQLDRGGPAPVWPCSCAARHSGAMTEPVIAQLAPAVDGIRLTLHVLAAAVWVGGQLTLAGLVPTARVLGDDAPARLGRAFSRFSWPAFAVLIATGAWNAAAVSKGQPRAWQIVFGFKMAVVVLAGVAAFLHTRSRSRSALAVWGALTGIASVAALVLGVFLAG